MRQHSKKIDKLCKRQYLLYQVKRELIKYERKCTMVCNDEDVYLYGNILYLLYIACKFRIY